MAASQAHSLAALCNATAGQLIEQWRQRVAGRAVTCIWALRTPPLSRCAWLRAVAALRQQYQTAQGGAMPPLPWYDEDEDALRAGRPAHTPRAAAAHGAAHGGEAQGGATHGPLAHGSGDSHASAHHSATHGPLAHGSGDRQPAHASRALHASAHHSALRLHVAVHIRRGDLRRLDRARYVSNERWTELIGLLAELLAEVGARWSALRSVRARLPLLEPLVHVMSSSDYDGAQQDALPLEKWRAALARRNVTLRAHVDADTLATMRHLIGADVLLKSNSGFSDTASLYSAAVKLVFFRSRDAQRQSFELHPTLARLRDDGARDTFVCTLLAHLAWKARALTEGR